MIKEMSVGILAGGKGVRMGELAIDTQKCLLPIDEKPILLYVMESLVEAFGSSLVFNFAVSHHANQVKEFVENHIPSGNASANFVFDNGIGTWNAFIDLKESMKGEFVGVPGDVVTTSKTYRSAMEVGVENDYPVVMAFSPALDEANTHDLGLLNGSDIVRMVGPDEELNSNERLRAMDIFYGSGDFFQLLERFPQEQKGGALTRSFIKAIENGQALGGVCTNEPWVHVVYKKDLNRSLQNV